MPFAADCILCHGAFRSGRRGHGIEIPDTAEAARRKLDAGWDRYAEYRAPTNRELKPDEIWGNYVLTDFGLDRAAVAPFSEELAHMAW